MTSVVLIGYGAIAKLVPEGLAADDESAIVAGILVRPNKLDAARAALPKTIAVITSPQEITPIRPDLVVECAGQGAVGDYGAAVLAAGYDFMLVSTGALVDDELRSDLIETAQRNGVRLLVPAGATAGLDGLAALRAGGLRGVRYTSTKPARAWKGTPAETEFDLDGLTEATVIFTGSAREAARRYPKNANIAATIALAGLGLDETQVRLVADPAATDNAQRIEAEGKFGTLRIDVTGAPIPGNPKTSANTAFSLLHAIRNRNATLAI
jgi:aspartate dehydrogenase